MALQHRLKPNAVGPFVTPHFSATLTILTVFSVFAVPRTRIAARFSPPSRSKIYGNRTIHTVYVMPNLLKLSVCFGCSVNVYSQRHSLSQEQPKLHHQLQGLVPVLRLT